MEETFEVSERRACEVFDQPRSTQRYVPRPADDEAAIVTRMLELVRVQGAYLVADQTINTSIWKIRPTIRKPMQSSKESSQFTQLAVEMMTCDMPNLQLQRERIQTEFQRRVRSQAKRT